MRGGKIPGRFTGTKIPWDKMKGRNVPYQGTLRVSSRKNQRSRAQCRAYNGMSAASVGGRVIEEKVFCSFAGKTQLIVGASTESCVSFADGAGVGVDSAGADCFAAQHGICAQQSGCLPIVRRQQSGVDAVANAGATCVHISIKLNQMAVICFTSGSLLPTIYRLPFFHFQAKILRRYQTLSLRRHPVR